jgi:signal transduction histidine kinase
VEAGSPPGLNPRAGVGRWLGRYVEGMFRSIAARWDPVAAAYSGDMPGPGTVPPAAHLLRGAGLLMVLLTVSTSSNPPGTHGRGLGVLIVLVVASCAWIVWMLSGSRQRLMVTAMVVVAGAGGILTGLTPFSGAIFLCLMMTFSAGSLLTTELSVAITAEVLAAFLITALTTGLAIGWAIGFPMTFIGFWFLGLTRRSYIVRAEQAERLLVDARRVRAAETEAAALGERARIAREIHDVLAHSLAAVSVNLQAAEGLMASVESTDPALVKALECVTRAGTLTREGLADARRAVLALRDDAAPLTDQLSMLTSEFGAAGDAEVSLDVTGPARPLSAGAGLAAFRTTQEALTNARKHAPGQPVRVSLDFSPDMVSVLVANPLPDAAAARPLSDTGAGYGLTGLRERAVLAGGSLDAGRVDGEWRVCLKMPT